ncbi:MAG TPA: hypothetical protein VML95_02115 [Longimicrobiales bacterium]|nr:hypothetical protein [Longimicrobiales bacterium]
MLSLADVPDPRRRLRELRLELEDLHADADRLQLELGREVAAGGSGDDVHAELRRIRVRIEALESGTVVLSAMTRTPFGIPGGII